MYEILFFSRYQSGFAPPGDIKFEDLSKLDPETATHSQFSSKVMNRMTLKETLSVHKLKKRPGIFSMFGNKVIFNTNNVV